MDSPLAYLNGRMMPFGEAALPLHDAGFVSGATVVDNARTYRHKLFRWPDHLARFRRDCETCFVPLELSEEQLTAAAEELVAHNVKLLPTGGELQLVTFATPGPLGFYLGDQTSGPATLGMVTYPLPFARFRQFFTEGAVLAVVGHQPADPSAILSPMTKHRSRMMWWKADQLAKRPPHPANAVALLTDGPDGSITETGFANFLCVIDGQVWMPPEDRVLSGISLRVTQEILLDLGIGFSGTAIPLREVPRMTEAMLTGTGFGIAGASWIDGHRPAWPGPVLCKLIAAWSDLVGLDIVKQFTG